MIVAGYLAVSFIDRFLLQAWVAEAGKGGIAVFLIVEYLYVVFVPLYNTPIHVAAGYIFGGSLGWLLNILATTAGLFTIIGLVKWFGRPMLSRLVSEPTLRKYDTAAMRFGPVALFAIYVAPFFPDDELTYIIAASQVSFVRYVLPVVFGNIAKTSVSYIGDQGTGGVPMAVVSRLAVLGVGIVVVGLQELMVARALRRRER
jgi:uncharacterized membrane protein YdjX (TVP38/TMEM64 family)